MLILSFWGAWGGRPASGLCYVDKVSSVTFRGNHRFLYHLDTWRSSKLVAVTLREYQSWAEDLASHQTSTRYTRLTSVTADCVKPRVASMMQKPQKPRFHFADVFIHYRMC